LKEIALLTLALEKPGLASPKLVLSLNKGARFTVTVAWSCNADHQDDVDIHALAARNDGNGARVSALEDVLSTYNTRRMNPQGGVLATAPDGSFQTPDGGLSHSGDMRVQNNSESIEIDGSKLAPGVNEVPLFATVHEADHGGQHADEADEDEEGAAFGDIDLCTITLKDGAGRELGVYRLSDEFRQFNAVQLGSVLLGPQGWEYVAVGRGFNGTLNDVLAHFS
jgi:tellurium resistance protein TerD